MRRRRDTSDAVAAVCRNRPRPKTCVVHRPSRCHCRHPPTPPCALDRFQPQCVIDNLQRSEGSRMKTSWLDDFVKWFFNASPMWVDERKIWKPTPDVEFADRRSQPRDPTEARRSNRNTRSSRS